MSKISKNGQTKRINFEDFLKYPNIRIASMENLLEKISLIKKDGFSKSLQVLIDFDRTFTSHTLKNGVRNVTSYECFMRYSDKSDILLTQEAALRDKYLPIEFSKELSGDEKIPHMIEWWQETNGMILDAKIHIDQVRASIEKSNLAYREGFDTFLDFFFRSNVPVMIGSAGLGDIVNEALKMWNLNFPNIDVASNFFDIDDNGYIYNFSNQLIHSYNKEIVYDLRPDYFEKNKDRKNILLFGDSLGDIGMVKNIPYADTIITVGFLNFDIEHNLDTYLNNFDIVVLSPNSCKDLTYLISVLSS